MPNLIVKQNANIQVINRETTAFIRSNVITYRQSRFPKGIPVHPWYEFLDELFIVVCLDLTKFCLTDLQWEVIPNAVLDLTLQEIVR